MKENNELYKFCKIEILKCVFLVQTNQYIKKYLKPIRTQLAFYKTFSVNKTCRIQDFLCFVIPYGFR